MILSQDVHRVFGGVVPELASRAHLTSIVPVVEPRSRRRVTLGDLDAVAVTYGRDSSVHCSWAVATPRRVAHGSGAAFIGVHHMEGHLFATALEHPDAVPPFTALLVSGGHTLLVDVAAWGEYACSAPRATTPPARRSTRCAKLSGSPTPADRTSNVSHAKANPAEARRFTFARPMLRGEQQPGDGDYYRRVVQRPQDRRAARGARHE